METSRGSLSGSTSVMYNPVITTPLLSSTSAISVQLALVAFDATAQEMFVSTSGVGTPLKYDKHQRNINHDKLSFDTRDIISVLDFHQNIFNVPHAIIVGSLSKFLPSYAHTVICKFQVRNYSFDYL